MKNKLLIGWSERDITPQKKVKLAGQFFERISEYVETPISVTAMAVEMDGEQMIICSCDLAGITAELVKLVRGNLKDKISGFDLSKIIVAATHTHTSIDYFPSTDNTLNVMGKYLNDEKKTKAEIDLEDVMGVKEAIAFIAERVSEAVSEAWNNRKQSYYTPEFARAVVGHCRRVVYDDNTAKMYGDTYSANFESLEGGNDSGVELLYTFDDEKKLTGVVINVACPSQVVEHRSFISSDYWGKVKMLLREKYGEHLCILGFRELDELAKRIPVGSDGLVMLPHLCGSTMPKYNPNAKGTFHGITLEHTRGHFVRSILEAVSCMLKNNLDYLGMDINEIRSIGGGASSELWCQIKSDMTGKRIATLQNKETACLGSAILAGVGIGIFGSVKEACDKIVKTDKVYSPSGLDYKETYESYCKLDGVLNMEGGLL